MAGKKKETIETETGIVVNEPAQKVGTVTIRMLRRYIVNDGKMVLEGTLTLKANDPMLEALKGEYVIVG